MKEIVGKCLRGIDWLSEWTGKIIAFLIPGLALIEGYEIVARYAFKSPTVWVHELCAMLFGTFILLGGAYTLLQGGHVNMDILYNRFSTRTRAVLDLITFFIFLAFIGVLLWKGWESAWRSIKFLEHDSTEWGPPLYPFKIMLPLGALLILLQGIAQFVRNFITVLRGDG